MTTEMRRTLKRTVVTLIAVALGMSLFATGVWAGSARDTSDQPPTAQAWGSFWNHEPQTGNPTGPAGQLDFWNYDPATGLKIADSSPGVAPEDLATLWSTGR